ncbi:MAG: hypothetical protein IPG84_12280 [Betaproteobacteria bacterium]|nr:hypothetical protein [Betaproteobacteria bacterium]
MKINGEASTASSPRSRWGKQPRTLGRGFSAYARSIVANHTGNSVSIIDTVTNSVLTTVPVGSGPRLDRWRQPGPRQGLRDRTPRRWHPCRSSTPSRAPSRRRSPAAAGRNTPPSTPITTRSTSTTWPTRRSPSSTPRRIR